MTRISWKMWIPSNYLTRRLSAQSFLFAIGTGGYAAGSAVFFLKVTGLTPTQVGLGASIDGAVGLIASVRLGRVADRLGAKRVWTLAAFTEGALFLACTVVRGPMQFYTLAAVIGVASAAAMVARGAYVVSALPRENRIEAQAQIRNSFTVGMGIGTLAGGALLLADGTSLLILVPVLIGSIMLINGFMVSRLPDITYASPPSSEDTSSLSLLGSAYSNWRVVVMAYASGYLTIHRTILGIIIPLWIATNTDAPNFIIGVSLVANSALSLLLQIPLSRPVKNVGTAVTGSALSAVFIASSLAPIFFASTTSGVYTVVVLIAGIALLTIGEVIQSAGVWGMLAFLPIAERRSEYQGLFNSASSAEGLLAPFGATYLVFHHGTAGWLLLGASIIAAGVLVVGFARALPSPESKGPADANLQAGSR